MEQLKTETFGKLKELGNSILGITYSLTHLLTHSLTHSFIHLLTYSLYLGNFGLSLDNFKMQQDPATGSWSINMGNK